MVCLFIGTTIREHTVTIRELASHVMDYISGIFIFRWWMIMGDERDLIVMGGKKAHLTVSSQTQKRAL